MYTVAWSSRPWEEDTSDGAVKVQYLPDIDAVLRRAFGDLGVKFVVITKED